MVDKAVAQIKSVGAEKAYQDFTYAAPAFRDRDLSVVVTICPAAPSPMGATPGWWARTSSGCVMPRASLRQGAH
ncbi:MAG TPA: hypothetical protein VKI41_16855 [Vicinamibacteria bacterium]|nr:hypothetical protein [Vicinamibacteria bacterium]